MRYTKYKFTISTGYSETEWNDEWDITKNYSETEWDAISESCQEKILQEYLEDYLYSRIEYNFYPADEEQ